MKKPSAKAPRKAPSTKAKAPRKAPKPKPSLPLCKATQAKHRDCRPNGPVMRFKASSDLLLRTPSELRALARSKPRVPEPKAASYKYRKLAPLDLRSRRQLYPEPADPDAWREDFARFAEENKQTYPWLSRPSDAEPQLPLDPSARLWPNPSLLFCGIIPDSVQDYREQIPESFPLIFMDSGFKNSAVSSAFAIRKDRRGAAVSLLPATV